MGTRRKTGSGLALFLVLLARAAGAAPAEVELSATTDREEVALDGTLVLTVTATYTTKGETGDLELPAFRDFDVVSRSQSEQVSFAFMNGAPAFRRSVATSIALTPKRVGEATIEPARLVWRGKESKTRPIRVHVLAAGGQSAQPQASQRADEDRTDAFDPFTDVHPGSKDLVLRASVDNDKPFVGQQATYSLYLLARINVSGIDKLQLPRLDGFWSEEVEAPQQLVGEARIIDGVPYRSFLLRRRALFPLRAGKTVVDPAEVEVLTGFGMLFSRGSAKRQSQPLTIDVQPLPAGKPPGFDPGNVGQWSLTASAEPANVSVGQPVTFRLVTTGRGNVRDLRLPRLPALPGVRAYDATSNDTQKVEKGQVVGSRTVEQLLVPERTGLVELPALEMDIFDPAQRAYRTLRTEAIRVQVAAATGAGPRLGEPLAQNLLGAGGLRPIRLRLSTASRAPPPWTQAWFWPLLGIGPFGVAMLLVTQRARRLLAKDPHEQRIKRARGAAKKRLKGAHQLLQGGDTPAFYGEIARAVTGYLADKQGVLLAGLTREELAGILLGRGHSDETVKRLVRLLDDCDRARFSPGAGGQVARETMLSRADQVIAELDQRRG